MVEFKLANVDCAADNVVKPVAEPPVTLTLPEPKFAICAPVAVKLAKLAVPPVTKMLPELKLVACAVVADNVANPETAPPVICAFTVLTVAA